jgi:hypothetical protein
MNDPEKDLRASWTADGVSQERQDQMIAQIVAKAQPGAMVGPFHINADFIKATQTTGHAATAVYCPTCQAKAMTWCIRPSGHRADIHAERKALADQVFIAQHGEDAWMESREVKGRVETTIHPTGYRSELTEAGEQTVIPGCEADAPQTGAKQLSLF